MLTTTCRARMVRRSPSSSPSAASAGRTSTVRSPVERASPWTRVTASRSSSMARFASRSFEVRASRKSQAEATAASGSSPGRTASARWTRALVGTHATLMHVPPTMPASRSTRVTLRPWEPRVLARVLPPLPQPITRMSVSSSAVPAAVAVSFTVFRLLMPSTLFRTVRSGGRFGRPRDPQDPEALDRGRPRRRELPGRLLLEHPRDPRQQRVRPEVLLHHEPGLAAGG